MARPVPAIVSVQLTLGALPSIVGLTMLAAAQIVAWILLPMTDVAGLWEWRGEVARTTGTVVEVRRTSTRVNSRVVRAVDFDHDGMRSTSYTTGTTLHGGESLAVEYPAGRPEHARIVGMERKPVPAWVLPLSLAPGLVGLVLLAVGIGRGRRALRLLSEGTVTKGTLSERTPTKTVVNGRRVLRLRYDFRALDGRTGQAVARSSRPAEETEAAVVYDPERLTAIVPAYLPGRPRIDENDTVTVASRALGIVGLVLFVVAVGGWATAIVVGF